MIDNFDETETMGGGSDSCMETPSYIIQPDLLVLGG